MDGYREHPSEFDLPSATETAPTDDVAAAIGTDERRMHVRAYNHWVSLLDGRDFPSIEDLEHRDLSDFAGNSVLLDFTCGQQNPAIPYIGAAIRDECGLDDDARSIADVPSRSLLSRLTDHYLQIIANRAPVGFEAEFVNQREQSICYRGILMPFSSDGEAIDFIYGVINWKKGEGVDAGNADVDDFMPVLPMQPAGIDEEPLELTDPLAADDHPTWDDTSSMAPEVDKTEAHPVPHFSWEDGPLADEAAATAMVVDADAGLADRLCAARQTAEAVRLGEGRTRAALYTALSLAYDFAIAARANPEDYAELLEESGVKAQERAPMTPIVKLVFGIDHDKARLTEYAAALAYAGRRDIAQGAFEAYIQKQPGGLKALVAAEREARRPEPRADTRGEAAQRKLRGAPVLSLAAIDADAEFVLVIARKGIAGGYEPIALVDDPGLAEKAIRRAG